MVSTTVVKHALAALATRTDTATGPYVGVIDEADAARADLNRAAGFVEAVGLERLATAVDAAAADGCHDIAARGRDALCDYRRFRTVAGEFETEDCVEPNACSDSTPSGEVAMRVNRPIQDSAVDKSVNPTSSGATAADNPPANSNPPERTADHTGP